MTKSTYFSRWQNGILSLGCAMLLFSCSHLEPFSLESDDVLRSHSDGPTVEPVIYNDGPGGNVLCSDIEGVEYKYTSGRIDYTGGTFKGSFPGGFTVDTDGTTVSWSFVDPTGFWCLDGVSVIVKGGPAANVYTYASGVNHDNGLVSPINPGDQQAGLSNLTFCYNLKPCDDNPDPCYKDETAWSNGPRYLEQGNWATYTEYQTENPVIIYAGQHHNVGTATFGPVLNGKVKITIALVGAKFEDVKENLKIHGYTSTPTTDPVPGRFKFKSTQSGTSATVTVDAAKFYGIHLNVQREYECPKPE